jgi:transposase
MSKSELSKQKKRAEVIIKVCAEKMSATEAAKELGVSRKTYYQWQKKALAAMMESLQDGQGGRPSQQEDAQTKSLREEQERLKQENDLLSIRLNIQKLMAEDMSQLPLIRKSKGYRTQKKTADP